MHRLAHVCPFAWLTKQCVQELERNLCVIKKAFAFKVPPASSAAGHK
jgi:hypothetical protein